MSTILAFIGFLTASAASEVHEPLPPLEIPEVAAPAGSGSVTEHPALDKLHPELRERLVRALEKAEAEGEKLRILSGFRPLDRKAARRGHASWHAFGLALDINLGEYTSMKGALANMHRDAARWERLGRLLEAEGLIWGGRWRAEEVFHVEWHPGFPAGLNGPPLRRLLALAGADGAQWQRTWPLFEGPHPPQDQVSKGRTRKAPKKQARKPRAQRRPNARPR